MGTRLEPQVSKWCCRGKRDRLECSDKDGDSTAVTESLFLGFGCGQWREEELMAGM